MHFGNLEIIAPEQFDEPWNEATVFGSAVWLWMQSAVHRDAPLHTLSALLLPAIKQRQFMLASEQGTPVFYMAWMNLSAEAERRYLDNPPVCMPEADWNSGERLWISDWVAPFGHTRQLSKLVLGRLWAQRIGRHLGHRGNERGLSVKTWQGIGVLPAEARAWFATHPLLQVS
ncbi:toxin-activating lysine-acyltransferase [Pseudomonas gingeri]|uniref:RTX toxin-activating lysine-acyltransferase n=1 Tax=Pseudomonas gingeri TaxID=117681 RepID=A0A7Y8C4J6_9PSED|nr:toxin-activating lysine-acyltransferase [Pseudomonas gingeri]NWB98387.1 toxin-activating lysine-acyltransferase [Pseudomonas gingeri]NWD71476.1 toxin-activating lysine-acyltransferase [Pseudomonas gingeri]